MEARMSARWPIVVAMLAAVACSSVAAPYREYEIRFEAPAPPSLDQSPSDGELIDAIAWLMRHRLDLPFPADIKAYVYVNEATFVDGLIKIGGEKIDEAWDRGRFASGVATRVGLFLRGDYLARTHLVGRAGLFAHELAHVSQSKLRAGVPGGRLARRAVWQREAHGIPRALRARRRSAGALGDGVPDPVSPVPRRVPRAAGWPGPAYAAGRSGQPAGIAAFFFSMIVRAYFSR